MRRATLFVATGILCARVQSVQSVCACLSGQSERETHWDRASRAAHLFECGLTHPLTCLLPTGCASPSQVRHGNEDTFREMLRIKRSVTAAFSNMHFNMAVIEIPTTAGELEAGGAVPVESLKRARAEDAMAGLEAAAAAAAAAPPSGNGLSQGLSMFVSAGVTGGISGAGTGPAGANPEEVELGDDDEEEAGGQPAEEARELRRKGARSVLFFPVMYQRPREMSFLRLLFRTAFARVHASFWALAGCPPLAQFVMPLAAAVQDVLLEQRAVPDAVFGGVRDAAAKAAEAGAGGEEPPRKKLRGKE